MYPPSIEDTSENIEYGRPKYVNNLLDNINEYSESPEFNLSPTYGPHSPNISPIPIAPHTMQLLPHPPQISDIPDLNLTSGEDTVTSINKDPEKEQNSQLRMLNVAKQKETIDKKDNDIKKL